MFSVSPDAHNGSDWFLFPPVGRLVAVLFAEVMLVFVGCEEESPEASIRVTPSLMTLQTGESADFTASGGSGYTWNLKYEDLGTLSAREGDTVRYTSTYGGVEPTVEQVLTVVGVVAGEAGGWTSGTGEARVAVDVRITLIPIGGNPSGSSSGPTTSTPVTTVTTTTTTISAVPTTTTTTQASQQMAVTASGSRFTIHNFWNDGSDYSSGTYLNVGQTYGVLNPTRGGESHTIVFSNGTWAGSNLSSFDLLIDASRTLHYP